MEDVWPSIKEANKDCPAHGRVMKDFIIPSNPEKPIPRAGKDAVQRHATHKLYENEFKAFYASKHGPVGYARKKSDTTETLRASPTNQDLSIEIKGQVGAAVERLLPQILTHQLSQAFGSTNGCFNARVDAISDRPQNQKLHKLLSETAYLYDLKDDDTNLFDCGLDSVQLQAFVERINSNSGQLGPEAWPHPGKDGL
ncbi:MAG: hypothetical protein LQ340_000766 [Diploschistes diacapsis]|nr:MAG: hypothetical protein LQ340_000766 [Diploschistes diacapsis]